MPFLCLVQIASITIFAHWEHYEVKEGLLEHKHCKTMTVNLIIETATK